MIIFVPFLGDFLSITRSFFRKSRITFNFRPLSWGLSFNIDGEERYELNKFIFVPFLGDFLSIERLRGVCGHDGSYFRPLSWGLSFNRHFESIRI